MTDLFDFKPKPKNYAVMGNPIAHSKSPYIHAAFARQCRQEMSYSAIQVDVGGLPQAVGNFQAAGGHGLNITVPFKREAWELCDERSARAERAGAVNTLICEPSGKRTGDNTDGVGLVRDILANHGGHIAGQRVLLLGAGGAVRGILGPILEQQPSALVIANRTVDKARELASEFASLGSIDACGYPTLAGREFDLIINGTAASLQDELPPLPDGIVAREGWCYDLMYAAAATAFMRWCHAQGASQVFDGLGMLVEQAAESFYLWRGVRPNTTPVLRDLREYIDKVK